MIPMSKWGKDHWSTFLYLETRIVDHRGIPNRRHIQANKNRHPLLVSIGGDGSAFGIRLANGVTLAGPDYDEWDCIDDMVEVGLLENEGTGMNPVFRLTELGEKVAGQLRAHKARQLSYNTFKVVL